MRITHEQYLEMLERLARGRKPVPVNTGEASVMEPAPGDAALPEAQAKEEHPGVYVVRVQSVRKRLLDPDNLCEKYHVDCLRYAGLIPGDEPDKIQIETTQRKAQKGEEERVEIAIIRVG